MAAMPAKFPAIGTTQLDEEVGTQMGLSIRGWLSTPLGHWLKQGMMPFIEIRARLLRGSRSTSKVAKDRFDCSTPTAGCNIRKYLTKLRCCFGVSTFLGLVFFTGLNTCQSCNCGNAVKQSSSLGPWGLTTACPTM